MIGRLTPKVSEKWDRRLENWALWYSGGKRIVAETSAYDKLEAQDNGDSRISAATWETRDPPAMVGEALDTNDLVLLLPLHLFASVRTAYCLSGPWDMRAADAGIHPNTLRNHVKAAHVLLEIMDGQRKRGHKPAIPATASAT